MPIDHSVAIVGLGPKGLYCFERLLAEFNAHPLRRGLQIHLFNRSAHFGASPIYDPEQPEYILVNVGIGEVDLWTATDPPIVAGRGPSFVDWYQETLRPKSPLNGNEYLSRAVVGRYLMDGFRRLLNSLPPGVSVSCHVGEVTDIRSEGRAYQVEFASEGGSMEEIRADKILLATGHSRPVPGDTEKRYKAFASRHPGLTFIPFVYPVVESMSSIPAGARVAMNGVGLTFIDAVLELTEGRGGRFVRSSDNSLSYTASGSEPLSIIPFCRSGLPMTPKADDLPPFMRPLTFFTSGALAELRTRKSGEKLDLENDLWPLFELEMELHYYRVVMGAGEDRSKLESCGNDGSAMRQVIDSYLRTHPSQGPLDYRQALDPAADRSFKNGKEFTSFVERYMEREIARARLGQAGCPLKAAIDIWYEVRKELGSVLQFGGLTPESHRKLIEHYFPRFKRIVFGPPIINIEKLLALVRAGLLDFSVARNPRVQTDDLTGCFGLQCDAIPNAVMEAEIMVDARYPSTNILWDATPLYRNLQRRGIVRAYENRSMNPDTSGYCPGAIDMTEGSNFVVDGEGIGNEDISVIGIPTEGNLIGNKTIARGDYPGTWAAEVIRQLGCRERALVTATCEE
ncbi:MAG: FAD/NAD(P)-binding protein [Pyrinomonadaceae bacterium]